MTLKKRILFSLILGIVGACAFVEWADRHAGPLPNPWKFIWNCVSFAGALASGNIHLPSTMAIYCVLTLDAGTLAYVLITTCTWIVRRSKRAGERETG